jgi:hypothetical protein
MVKAAKGKGKNAVGQGSFSMMDNALASFSGYKTATDFKAVTNMLTPYMGRFSGVGAGLIGNAPAIMQGAASMMPNFGATINRATGYYNAIQAQGGNYGRASFERSVMNGLGAGGLTGPGSDAAVAQILSGSGVAFSNAKGSFFQSTLRGVGNMARYFNMSNESAANAMVSLSSGSMSSMLMRGFGVATSDTSGRQLSTGQIINQLSARLSRGKFTEKDVMNSFYRGNLGASLQSSGLSQDQQMMVVQSLMAQAKGKTFDPSSDQAMKDAFGGASGKNGNPTDFQRGIYTSQSNAMGSAEGSYIAGASAAGKALEGLTIAGGTLAHVFGGLTAAATVLMGTMAGAGGMSVLGGVGKGMAAGQLAKGGGKLPGFIGKMKASPVGGAIAKAGKLGGKMGAGGTAAAVMGGVSMASDLSAGQGLGSKQFNSDLGGTIGGVLGGVIGTAIGPEGTILGGIIGSTLGGAVGSFIGGLTGAGGGRSSSGSFTGVGGGNSSAGTPTQVKAFRLSKPVRSSVKPTAVYGQKTYQGKTIWPNGHNGVDFPVLEGTAVLAAADGNVVAVHPDYNGELGLHIIIRHPDSPKGNMHTLYAHLSGANVKSGDSVSAGAVIGSSGRSGTKVTGAHLHFALQTSPSSADHINPAPYLDGIPAVLSPDDTGVTSSPDSMSGANNMSTSGSSTATTGSQTAPTATIQGDALTVGVSGIAGKAASISSQINGGANMGGSNSKAPAGTGVGGGNTSSISGVISSGVDGGGAAASMGASGGRGNGSNVTINLSIAKATDDEARRFATKVKQILEEDKRRDLMGRL